MREFKTHLGHVLKRIAGFDIYHRQLIDRDGVPVAPLPSFAKQPDFVRELYQIMVLTRSFDERAIALQRTGRLGTYASSLGQEAVAAGVASAMKAEDVLLPSFREHAAKIRRGVSLVEMFQFWGGDERGNNYASQRRDFPDCIPVGSHFPHAAGVGLALKLREPGCAAVAIAGDGATSKGDFYEALNIAGSWSLPVVFVICNNAWAISVPCHAQTRAQTLAQKAIAAGIDGEQVDGNDIFAVHASVTEALEAARHGKGPRLIEAITYRLSDHTTADDARRYRDDAEVSAHWEGEPVARLRAYMATNGWWNSEQEQSLLQDCRKAVEMAANAYLVLDPEPPTAAIDHLFEFLPEALKGQRAMLAERGDGSHG